MDDLLCVGPPQAGKKENVRNKQLQRIKSSAHAGLFFTTEAKNVAAVMVHIKAQVPLLAAKGKSKALCSTQPSGICVSDCHRSDLDFK